MLRLSCLPALQAAPAGQWIAVVIVVLDESLDLSLEVTGQIVVLQQVAEYTLNKCPVFWDQLKAPSDV